MFARRFSKILSVALVVMLGMAGCATGTASHSNGVESATGAVISSDTVASSQEVTASSEVTSSPEVTVSSSTQGSTEATTEPVGPGETSAGAATENAASETESGDQVQAGAPVAYRDSTYKFTVTYPDNFVAGTLLAENLAQLTPTPEVALTFMNPETAASDLADAEPADLEIRIFRAGDEPSLESWLLAKGLIASDGSVPQTPFHTSNTDGVRVCPPTMLAPGCAYFVMGNGFVYQMTPATINGEEMAKSFTLTP